jgi:enoyl-CoA hydratase/carnithine racemase
MADIDCRIQGCAGRITLNRPKALNALTWEMCIEIDKALISWADDPEVKLLIVDGLPCEKAFCAGGDLTEMYATGKVGDYSYGQRFWQDEYRMNARMFNFPKPVVTFLHGFVMGGGVGVGCHGSHRIVCDDTRLAMPECKIGLVPDVGGSLILSRATGRLGEYLSLTAARMGPGDAIHAGFADYYLPRQGWADLIATLSQSGDVAAVDSAAQSAPASKLAGLQDEIDACFGGERLRDVVNLLEVTATDLARSALKAMEGNSPISMACTVELIHRTRGKERIEAALELEYRFTSQSMQRGDFLEGIRALIIDKDNAPRWRHDGPKSVPLVEVSSLLMPRGPKTLTF